MAQGNLGYRERAEKIYHGGGRFSFRGWFIGFQRNEVGLLLDILVCAFLAGGFGNFSGQREDVSRFGGARNAQS